MAKQPIKYKVIRQSSEMGAKFYGVIDNADPINAELTMEQIIDRKKLHNFSAKQLSVLVEDVLQGAAELVARDGMPRNLSTLLKFEARIRGTFANSESGITDQIVLVKPRMLKDIKVNINKDDFTFINASGDTSPKISGLAQESNSFTGWTYEGAFINDDTLEKIVPFGPLTVSGVRLAPDGWTSDCKVAIAFLKDDKIYRLDRRTGLGTGDVTAEYFGMWDPAAIVASDNVLKFNKDVGDANAWEASSFDPTLDPADVAVLHPSESGSTTTPGIDVNPFSGYRLIVAFARTLKDGSGSIVMTTKEVAIL